MTIALEVKEFSPDTWADFEALFGKHKGVRGGCWCVFNRCTSTQFNQMTRDERKELQHNLALQGSGCGLLIYDGSTPVAWCQFGPAQAFGRFDRGRDYKKLSFPADLAPQWRITCLFVDKHRRHEGLSKFALRAALESIARRGGGVVEAFPFDVPEAKRPSYTGSVKMYKEEGFQEAARLGSITVLMRRVVPANPG
jgi:GNAT superfamily N-acetyltransferase